MPTFSQTNKLILHEIHTRPELWKDKIYYLERNPYWNSSYDYLPIPKKYAEIIQEFQAEIKRQKDLGETTKQEKAQAEERRNKIYQQIKEIIQQKIEEVENYPIEIDEGDLQELEEKQEEVRQIISDIKQFFKEQLEYLQDPEQVLKSRWAEKRGWDTYISKEDNQKAIQELTPYLKETSFKKFKEWEKKWGTITKTIEEEDFEREIDLLAEWEELNGGQLPLKKEELKDYSLKEGEKAKAEYLKKLKIGLTKKSLHQFHSWNQQVELNLNYLLDQWKEVEGKIKQEYNNCFILEHTNEYLKFTFQPPRQIFVNLKDFLFYRSNTWYEVESWERINHVNAVITCKRSIFLSYYVYFLSKGANGVLHSSPRLSTEICQCPSFLESTYSEEMPCSWEPKYGLFRIESAGGTAFAIPRDDQAFAPYLSTIEIAGPLTGLRGWDSLSDTTYLLLPKAYHDRGTYWNGPGGTKGEKIYFTDPQNNNQNFSLKSWSEKTGNELNAHTVFHVSTQFYWRKKLLGTYTLADFNPSECYLKIKANGAAIVYTLTSGKVYLRWSEDVKTTIEKDRMVGMFSGMVQKFTGIALGEATKALFHDQNTEESKASEERQTERKTKYVGSSKIVSSAMASLPSMLAPSHVKCDYTMAEFALRYEQPSLKLRIEYNSHLFDRYKMEKTLKKNGNEWFNWEKIGNYINKGYWKIVPHIFEGDRDGFFASIFSKGVYFYEEDPHEYFTLRLERGKYRNGQLVGGNPQIESVFQKDLEETGGHDDISHMGGGLWVHKTSFIQRKDGSGDNILVNLFNQAVSYRNTGAEDSGKWVFKHPQTWSTEITMDEYAMYVYDLRFFSSTRANAAGVKGATKIIAEQISEGNKSEIKVRFIGELEIQQVQDDPNEIGQPLPGGGSELDNIPEQEPEQNDDLINQIEKQEEPEGEQGQEKQPEEELQPEPEEQKQEEKQDEPEQEDEKSKEKTKEKQKQKQKQKEDELQDDPENSRQDEK